MSTVTRTACLLILSVLQGISFLLILKCSVNFPLPWLRQVHNITADSSKQPHPESGWSHKLSDARSTYKALLETKNFEKALSLEEPDVVVLMIIDALRVDFVKEENLPYIYGLLSNKTGTADERLFARKLTLKIKNPTVTLPRIKAMVTGVAPDYWDIIKNFQTASSSPVTDGTQQFPWEKGNKFLNQDNILWQLKKKRPEKKLCFYGDETWLRLFPSTLEESNSYSVFHRSEQITSFFVQDFYKVDSNVTRRFKEELERYKADSEPCNFLILHYLGLDHIGHVHRPFDRLDLINNKLLEMDNVVKNAIKDFSSLQKKILFLICGDHGMANIGGHGGNSIEETLTPLIAVFLNAPHGNINKHSSVVNPVVLQEDLAPTLSMVLGVDVPAESHGRLIKHLMEPFLSTSSLFIAYIKNCLHFLHFLSEFRPNLGAEVDSSQFKNLTIPIIDMGLEESHAKNTEYLMLFEEDLSLLIQSNRENEIEFSVQMVFYVFILITISFTEVILFVFWLKTNASTLVLLTIPSLTAYLSSSLVEEEHRFRYFVYGSWILCCMACTGAVSNPFSKKSSFKSHLPKSERHYLHKKSAMLANQTSWVYLLAIIICHRIASGWNSTGQKWNQLADLSDFAEESYSLLVWLSILSITGCSILLKCSFIKFDTEAVLRSLNVSLPDKLTFFSAVFIILTKCISKFEGDVPSVQIFVRIIGGSQSVRFMQKLSLFMPVLNSVVSRIFRKEFPPRSSLLVGFWMLFLCLTKLENYPILFLIFCQLFCWTSFAYYTNRTGETVIGMLWLAYCAFFYQGNSNGLNTVDINAGYFGMEGFNSSLMIGLLIFLNTYCGPILVILWYFYISHTSFRKIVMKFNKNGELNIHKLDSMEENEPMMSSSDVSEKKLSTSKQSLSILRFLYITERSHSTKKYLLFSSLLFVQGIESLVYAMVMYFHRDHLFIWTVFVPKLMYLATFSILQVIILLTVLVIHPIVD